MSFTLPDLDYSYNALERSIDARTMEIHHSKHHAGYTNNLNAAIDGTPLADKSIEAILADVSTQSVEPPYPSMRRFCWASCAFNRSGLP